MAKITDSRERLVVNNRNNPAIPKGVSKEAVTRQGVGLIDFTGDESFSTDGDTHAESQSFSTLARLSTKGGYGVIHTKGFETVVVGRVATPCVMFPTLGEGDPSRGYKAFVLTEFAEAEREQFPDLYEALSNRAHLATLHEMDEGDENPGAETVVDAFVELEMSGDTRSFSGLNL